MAITVVPYAGAHVDASLAMLAERHRAMRGREPHLTDAYDQPGSWTPLLRHGFRPVTHCMVRRIDPRSLPKQNL